MPRPRDSVWWGKTNVAMIARPFRRAQGRFLRRAGAEGQALCRRPVRRLAAEHRVNVRVINELAWHNLFIRTLLVRPERHEIGGFVPEYTIIDLPSFRADPARHGTPHRNGDRRQFRRKADPDRRHRLCRRDEEERVRHPQLSAAGQGHHADALFGQCRPGRRHRGVLRPVRHRQDDAVGRRQPHPDRRRRAWLVGYRRVQFRRRLLRQDDPAFARGRAGNLRDHQALRHGAGKRGDRSGHPPARFRRQFARREQPRLPTRSTSFRMLRKRTSARSRPTSSSSPPTPMACCRRSRG